MGDLFLMCERQMGRNEGYFQLSHGVQHVVNRRVVSEIVYVIRYGPQWKDASKEYGPTRRSATASSAEAGASSQALPGKGRGLNAS